MTTHEKSMAAARDAWIASDVSTRFFSDVEHCALESAIRAYISSAIPGEVAELAGDLHSFADRLAHVRNPTDMLTVRSAATALTSLAARIEALEVDLKRERHRATNAEYFKGAYRNMLGPIARQVAEMWREKGVTRVHFSWGPEADNLTGEERAQAILDFEAAPRRQSLDFGDGNKPQVDVAEFARTLLKKDSKA